METNNDVVVCVDCSASTKGHKKYWKRVLEVIEEYNDGKFVIWSSRAKYVSYEKIKLVAKNRWATGGTSPSLFVNFAKTHSKVIIITDGQVSHAEVDRCDEMLKNTKFNYVKVIFIDTGGRINLSVAAPFTRNTKFTIENGEEIIEGNSSINLDFTLYKNNPALFLDDFEKLRRAVIMKSLGKYNKGMRNRILNFKEDLIKFMTTKGEDYSQELLDSLNKYDYEDSIVIAKKMYDSCFDSMIDDVNHAFESLLNSCDLKNNFSFSLIAPTRIERAKATEEYGIDNIESIEGGEEFECPITMNFDSPCLLIRLGAPALRFVNKKDLEMILTNPLIVLNREDIKDNIKRRIDSVIGFKTFKELFSLAGVEETIISPYSRQYISCGIVLGEEDEHLKAFNHSLSRIFFGTTLVGSPVLWTYVLYKVLKEVEYVNEHTEFFKEYEKFFINRLKSYKTNITLSGLPIHPLIQTSADIAVWYSVVSPFVIKISDKDDSKNRLRTFGNTSIYLLEILDLLGYPYDKKKTLKLISLYRAFAWMMHEEKNEGFSSHIENQWLKKIKSHYQGSIVLDDNYIILVDGPVTEPIKLPNFKVVEDQEELTLNELLYLAELVDAGKTVNSVVIDLEKAKLHPIPDYITSYGYDYSVVEEYGCKISSKTMRPFAIDRDHNKFWKERSEEKFSIPIEKQVSCYARIISYVESKLSFPTKNEFLKYLEKRERMREDFPKLTLPRTISKMIDGVFITYEEVCGKNFCNTPVEEFIEKSKSSYSVLKRLEQENSDKHPLYFILKKKYEEKKLASKKQDKKK